MKREFLQNLKVGEEALPKEVIDAIMDENGRDIEAAKTAAVKPYADYDEIKAENQRLKDNPAEGTVDGKTAAQWKEAHDQAVSNHQKELEGIKFQGVLDSAITVAKGKNAKAINEALEGLKKTDGYLFDTEGTPPPYAPGPGAGKQPPAAPDTLASALREKFANK